MKLILKALFGGGSSYIYIAGALIIGGLYFDYTRTKEKNAELEQTIKEQTATIEGKNLALITQSQTQQRRSAQKDLSDDADSKIRNTKDGNNCVSSEPMSAAFEWLRLNPDAPKPNTD